MPSEYKKVWFLRSFFRKELTFITINGHQKAMEFKNTTLMIYGII